MSKAHLLTNNHNVDLVISPMHSITPLTETDIVDLVNSSEYRFLYLDKLVLKKAIIELNEIIETLPENETGEELTYPLLQRQDALIRINISEDKMTASAEISTALGGKHLSAKAILQAAQQIGIQRGFSRETLVQFAIKAAKAPSGTNIKCDIAIGLPAKHGTNAFIKPLVDDAQNRILKPKKLDDGSVDMRDLGDIVCVNIGDAIAEKIPLTKGTNGYTVTGEVITAMPGEDIEMKIGHGTAISPDNANIIISTLAGLPRIVKNGMKVDNVYKVRNVDVKTGHIDFQGSVLINGDVLDGMKVTATGDISVKGVVESATLNAGGDITIKSGIIGKKQDLDGIDLSSIDLSANISAGGKVFAKYCQYASINCNILRIENQLMHSFATVKTNVWLGNTELANGKLIAGYINVGNSVSAGAIGAVSGTKTIISFASKADLFIKKLAQLDEDYINEEQQGTELKKKLENLKELPRDKTNIELLKTIATNYKEHAIKLADLISEKNNVNTDLQNYLKTIYVDVTENIFPGVQFIIGENEFSTTEEYGPSKMIFTEQKIQLNELSND